MDYDSEPKLMSLITGLVSVDYSYFTTLSRIVRIICFVSSMDLESQPKPESKLMSLTSQTISVFNSMDLDSQPKPLLELMSFISTKVNNSLDSDSESEPESEPDSEPESDPEFTQLLTQAMELDPEPELISLIHQIFSLVVSMYSKWENLISLCPQVQVRSDQGKVYVDEQVPLLSSNKWCCLAYHGKAFKFSGEVATHFRCQNCNGKNHDQHHKAPVEIKHTLHPKHSLQLVLLQQYIGKRKCCYCCNEDLLEIIYYCTACDIGINFACAETPPALYVHHPKWHEHILVLFPRKISLACNLCGLSDSTCFPFYMCSPCDFVVHESCISLPSLIRISRHRHRISFTPSFDQGDWFCGVCRRKIDNEYGGYSCIKDDCSYAAHSRCATQSNVWDGNELEGEPEEVEEEYGEPFVRISDGIIQHFSHQHHHLRLDENTCKEYYDENKECQACNIPIYSGNFYSCIQCDFILHEACANYPRKLHHPIHPHLLTLVGGNDSVLDYRNDRCSACPWLCRDGFSYECGKEGCHFVLHVQCGTISEPLLHGSHTHPLYLTSKPGEGRMCSVCKCSYVHYKETFNCIECDFALCFECATLPEKVKYKHDKHMLALSYGEETSTMIYWCELCERRINPKERFYKCDEYCCVTLHIECMLGVDLYMKHGSSWFYYGKNVRVLPNNIHMSRPICSSCEKRCPYKIVFLYSGLIFCSGFCLYLV